MTARVVVGDDHALGGTLRGIADALRRSGIEVVRIGARPAPELTPYRPGDDVDVVVISSRTVIDAEGLRAAGRLRGVVFPSIGTGSCDAEAASRLGVVIANGATAANVRSMAEATVLLVLALLYQLPAKQAAFRRPWTGSNPPVTSRMLRGRTLGLIGFGRISQQSVRLLAGWGVGPVLAHTRTPPVRDWPQVRFTDLPDLLARSDVVVVNLPATPQTRGLLDRSALARMKPGSYLVNAARGGIVDEDALAELLRRGHVAGAAVDTFATEPPPPGAALRTAPNTILTNHVVGHTVEMFDSFVDAAVDNVHALLAGRPPEYTVNPDCLPAWRLRVQAGAH